MFNNNDPDFQLVAEEWPTFLYDEAAGWNVEKAENGLFRGHVLTRVGSMPSPSCPVHCPFTPSQVALRVFRNKTAAEADGPGRCYDARKRSKGPRDFLTRHEIRRITPRMIAYAALQASPVAPSSYLLSNNTQILAGLHRALSGRLVRGGWDLQPHPFLPRDCQDPLK